MDECKNRDFKNTRKINGKIEIVFKKHHYYFVENKLNAIFKTGARSLKSTILHLSTYELKWNRL